ncbi:hypothetical protein TOPH_01799 [Tolypocladium ophioglossoides CBS 100239]|uniref:Uncharacterized protein n=1 Tax=Tolypocladium ophioglossoides (strain CBS 100239) TaxID=1163406 RepID=A0A0L0NIS3_TOLOC|nr:hypothetical protein TOPH_01799 [Tolypocladium ophioglossoides CBS 100239]
MASHAKLNLTSQRRQRGNSTCTLHHSSPGPSLIQDTMAEDEDDHPTPQLKHEEDFALDGDSHTLWDSPPAAEGTDKDQVSEAESSTVAPTSEPPSSGELMDIVATFRELLGDSDSDDEMEDEDGPRESNLTSEPSDMTEETDGIAIPSPEESDSDEDELEDDTNTTEIPAEDEDETESEHGIESPEAQVEDEDDTELEHEANSPEAPVTDEDEAQAEHHGKPLEPETSTCSQNLDGDAEDAISETSNYTLPAAERQSKERRDDDDDNSRDDKRRAKRFKRKMKARRLEKLILKEARKSTKRKERKYKRRHGLAVINEAGLPTPTEDTFPSHIFSRDDDDAD